MNEMKKWFLISVAFIVYLILSPYCAGIAEEVNIQDNNKTFILPSSLRIIEDEAFEGTAVTTVVFPDGLLSIGEKAFENALFLTDVYIPDTTEYIAETAFSITQDLTIHGIDGSYAKDWAHRHGIPFVVDDIWNVYILRGRTDNSRTKPVNRFIATVVLIVLLSIFKNCYYELRSRRPQDRPELNPIDYRFP